MLLKKLVLNHDIGGGGGVTPCVPIHKLSEINFHFSMCFNILAWMLNQA